MVMFMLVDMCSFCLVRWNGRLIIFISFLVIGMVFFGCVSFIRIMNLLLFSCVIVLCVCMVLVRCCVIFISMWLFIWWLSELLMVLKLFRFMNISVKCFWLCVVLLMVWFRWFFSRVWLGSLVRWLCSIICVNFLLVLVSECVSLVVCDFSCVFSIEVSKVMFSIVSVIMMIRIVS